MELIETSTVTVKTSVVKTDEIDDSSPVNKYSRIEKTNVDTGNSSVKWLAHDEYGPLPELFKLYKQHTDKLESLYQNASL